MPPRIIRKKYGYTASVLNGTNRVIACSKTDWSVVRDGSFIILDKDNTFYKVIARKRYIYQKEATVLNELQLKVNQNVGIALGIEDDLAFSYKGHGVVNATVKNAGEGYEVGSIIRVEGGTCKYNSIDEIDVPALFTVTNVNDDGGIVSIEINNSGVYNLAPENECNVLSDSGSGASLVVTASMLDVLSIEDRSIVSVELNSDHTIINLNHPLPPRLEVGTIKIEKWELILNIEYAGGSKYNVDYDIIKDFTPNYEFPLIHDNLPSSHLMYNEAMSMLDRRLKDIEDKLN